MVYTTDNETVTADPSLVESLAEQIAFNVINAIIGVLGIVGNGTVLSVFVTNWKSFQSLTHLLIFHQSIIDFISSIVFTLLRMDRRQPLLAKEGVVGEIFCRLWHSEYPLWALFMTSTLNLVVLSTERYIAVVHPVFHLNKLTRNKVKISMAIIWTVSFVYQSYLAFTNTNVDGQCVLGWEKGTEPIQTFVGVLTFLFEYLCPLCVMSIDYTLIALKLRELDKLRERRRHEALTLRSVCSSTASSARNSRCQSSSTIPRTLAAEHNGNETVLSQQHHLVVPTHSMDNNPANLGRNDHEFLQHRLSVAFRANIRRVSSVVEGTENNFSRAFRNVIRTLIVVFLVNVVCWTPAEFEYFIYNLGGSVNFDSVFHKIAVSLILCNMVCNPFVYCVQYKEFQRSFKRTFCFCIRDNRIDTSTQSR